jgi:hypothetical protein
MGGTKGSRVVVDAGIHVVVEVEVGNGLFMKRFTALCYFMVA